MPQDLLQIALEHHRAGRLRQAEAGYRALLAEEGGNPDAAHWLGVLMVQAGRAKEAVELLEKAAAARPTDAAYAHNLGQAYLACGRGAEAIDAFDHAVQIDPARPQALYAAATARLARNAPGDAQSAIALFNRARAAGMDSAELHQHLGIALLATGSFEQAITSLRASLDKDASPSRVLGAEKNRATAQTYHQLGIAHRLKGDMDEARRCMSKAIELQPGSARACQALAVMEAEAGGLAEAEALFRRAILISPQSAEARQGLAMVLEQMGTHADSAPEATEMPANKPEQTDGAPVSESIAELERKITPSPSAAALHFRLALTANVATPAQVPAESLGELFDRYADRFDEHLQGKLDYRVPELIARAIALTHPRKMLDTLELGCGTGLCGPLLRPMAATLSGVDISPAMIEKAQARDVYDRLEAGELLEFLGQTGRSFDLVVAADVLIYWGDLSRIFQAVAASLRPEGLFAFSVESGPGDRFQFNKQTHRFTHSEPYLKSMAAMFGFKEKSVEQIVIRSEAAQPVHGYLIVLQSPSSGD
jgi:predicted TPR repeat methyltransferase